VATRVLAIDWSGASSGARHHIWLAEATEPGRLVRLEAGRDRDQLAQHLKALQAEELVIGLDFAFSFPAWFVAQVGSRSAKELWAHVGRCGEAWLAACEPPFWGRPGRCRPAYAQPALRRTDMRVPRTAGIAPKSVFQIGGNIGTALGPLILSFLIAWRGLSGIWVFAIPGTVIAALVLGVTSAIRRAQQARADRASGASLPARRGALALLVAVVSLRSVVYGGLLALTLYVYSGLPRDVRDALYTPAPGMGPGGPAA